MPKRKKRKKKVTEEQQQEPQLEQMSEEERQAFIAQNERAKAQLIETIVQSKGVLSLQAVMVGMDVYAYFPPDEKHQWDFLGIAPGASGVPQGMWRVARAQSRDLVLPPGVR